MKVILNKDWANLGEEGDVVEVKAGYARNFLLPQNIAVLNTKENQSYFKAKASAIQKRKEEKKLQARSVKEKLQNYEVKVVLPAGEKGRVFGSVTALMIQDIFHKDGIEIERKKIDIQSHAIKIVGTYSFNVSLYGGESVSVKLIVEAEEKRDSSKDSKRSPKNSRSKAEASEEKKEEAPEAAEKEEKAEVNEQ